MEIALYPGTGVAMFAMLLLVLLYIPSMIACVEVLLASGLSNHCPSIASTVLQYRCGLHPSLGSSLNWYGIWVGIPSDDAM